jgi:hypothetical protein
MSDQQNEHTQTTDVELPPAGLNTSRRKLVRAGLAAAPVVAAFKTNMVLATPRGTNVTVRASAHASLVTTGGSVAPNAQTTGLFIPMSECEREQGCDDLLFGPSIYNRGTKVGCGFDRTPSPDIARKTLKQVFKIDPRSDMERLAQYLAAGYLSAKRYGMESYISEKRCKEIWRQYGEWEPTAGVLWGMPQTLDYFKRVYSGTGFSDCLINPLSRSGGSCG